MTKDTFFIYLLVLPLLFNSCKKKASINEENENEWYSGGKQTVFTSGAGAYSAAFPLMRAQIAELHGTGDALFDAVFNSDPSQRNFGLGPLYNNVSCNSCHVSDGRGKAPEPGEDLSALLIRISSPGANFHGGPQALHGYGIQLQNKATFNVHKEADIKLSYIDLPGQFPDGESYSLRKPVFNISNEYMPMQAGFEFSPRISVPVFGLGLLEALSEQDILANADVSDDDKNGVSGKPNYVWDYTKQKKVIGRFGWKAGQPSVLQQTALAFNEDIGVTNYLFPDDNAHGQSQANVNNAVELKDSLLFAVGVYIKTLAVPGRRNVNDAKVIKGKSIFMELGCSNCHVPKFTTPVNVAMPEFSAQVIYPYTDLLLHDMGNGLADDRKEFEAEGYEWRTRPLWGIGLTRAVNGHSNFLHDGRARNLTEAIMWHGGEAGNSMYAFAHLTKEDREALIQFLESL